MSTIEQANHVLARLAQEPDKTWHKTQRDLSLELGITQATLCRVVQLLEKNRRVVRGESLPMRGKNHALIAADTTPLSIHDRKVTELKFRSNDRLLPKEEEEAADRPRVTGPVSMTEMLGHDVTLMGVKRLLAIYEEEQQKMRRSSVEMQEKIRVLRAALEDEKRKLLHSEHQREHLERLLECEKEELVSVRAQLNRTALRSNTAVPARELMDDASRRAIDSLMREKPGFARECEAV